MHRTEKKDDRSCLGLALSLFFGDRSSNGRVLVTFTRLLLDLSRSAGFWSIQSFSAQGRGLVSLFACAGSCSVDSLFQICALEFRGGVFLFRSILCACAFVDAGLEYSVA